MNWVYINPFNTKPISGRKKKKKKKKFFTKFYSYFSFYAGEISLEIFFFFSFFLRKLIELFHRIMNFFFLNQARYEIFRQKPSTLTLFWWRFKRLVALKGLKEHLSVIQVGTAVYIPYHHGRKYFCSFNMKTCSSRCFKGIWSNRRVFLQINSTGSDLDCTRSNGNIQYCYMEMDKVQH